ncbi:hypothetical protein Tsp_11794 [Trichinella spiralis]|uniref:hypothetical protein n=1 Tax=Trichinella spiralis TaxID=6334 RepID=UPI0001EFEC38|nr:hypothetical protein Tsp_11794 [Trichinella spiralis]
MREENQSAVYFFFCYFKLINLPRLMVNNASSSTLTNEALMQIAEEQSDYERQVESPCQTCHAFALAFFKIGRCGRGGLERRRAAFSHTHGRQPGTADARRRAEPSPHYPPAPTTAGRFGVHHAHAGCHTRRRASRPRSGRSFQPDSPRPPRIGGIRLRKEHADRSRRALRPSHSFVVSTIRSNCSRKCRQKILSNSPTSQGIFAYKSHFKPPDTPGSVGGPSGSLGTKLRPERVIFVHSAGDLSTPMTIIPFGILIRRTPLGWAG